MNVWQDSLTADRRKDGDSVIYSFSGGLPSLPVLSSFDDDYDGDLLCLLFHDNDTADDGDNFCAMFVHLVIV